MDVILHIGAHRCATTTFQAYLRASAPALARAGIEVWGPRRTRNGLFHGVLPNHLPTPGRDARQRAIGRVQLRLAQAEAAGCRQLIVTDENLLGTMRENLRLAGLYGGAGERLARYQELFEGRITRVAVSIRALDFYWASALGYAVQRGLRPPRRGLMERIAASGRSWRDVIEDAACALSAPPLVVLPFERYAGRPEAQLAAMTGLARPPVGGARLWLNATPPLERLRAEAADPVARVLPAGTGRWMPFLPAEAAALRERYADDLFWLVQGAGGVAGLAPDPDRQAGEDRPPDIRGRDDDIEEGPMAGAG